MSTSLSPFKQGAVVQVAQGVLRGIGPMGPRGFTGPMGPPGPQGSPGIQPEFEPVAASWFTTTPGQVSTGGLYERLELTTGSYNIPSTFTSLTNGSVLVESPSTEGVALVITAVAVVAPSSGVDDFTVELGVFAGTSPNPFASSVFQHDTGTTASTLTFTTQVLAPSPGAVYGVGMRVTSGSVPVSHTFASLSLSSAGGPRGFIGPVGPTGPAGPTGPQGPPGSGGAGYANLLDLDVDGTPWDGTGITLNYNDQGLPYPTATDGVKTVFFHRSMADQAGRKVVRRFASATVESVALDREIGQVFYSESNEGLHVLTDNGSGEPEQSMVAQVVWSTNDPPVGVVYPAGTIWLKVV